ncbi:MAG: hypothetical protein US63_C0012G0003 [Candidatus Moranbacteria bacterium GW2011_GWC2_37_8]|nr:MAG: hypothetical protein US63_C0012G0003 [Candidatus Moranbacteria bacterium GW2011_GWC2_37_8]KKQ62869.1 MAG: hypothetical protein US82_C0005G0042 [Parcubacteria group bacterium GW2011_GWC1_38_22]
MDNDKQIRKYLLWILDGGDAHMNFDSILKDFPMNQINVVFPGSTYSFWGALEHVRRTQEDIIDFIENPKYKERKWPEDYWPRKEILASASDWNKTIKKYKQDLEILKKIITNPQTNLYEKIPHGSGQTVFREILLIVDHTSYQLGELATMRRVFGHWDITHE